MANEPKARPLSLTDTLRALRNVRSEEPDPPADSFTALAALLAGTLEARSQPVIEDRWFKDETIKIDGYTFERCRFDHCRLVTETATYALKQCFVSPDSGLVFAGPALKAARLLMHMLRLKGRITMVAGEEAIFAPVHPDGTFSIE